MSGSNVETVFAVARESETYDKLREEISPEKAALDTSFSSPRRLNATGSVRCIAVRNPSGRGVASRGIDHDELEMNHDTTTQLESTCHEQFVNAAPVTGVPAVSSPQPGHRFRGIEVSASPIEGGVRGVRGDSRTIAYAGAHAPAHTPIIDVENSRDSRDTLIGSAENGSVGVSLADEGVRGRAGTPPDVRGRRRWSA